MVKFDTSLKSEQDVIINIFFDYEIWINIKQKLH